MGIKGMVLNLQMPLRVFLFVHAGTATLGLLHLLSARMSGSSVPETKSPHSTAPRAAGFHSSVSFALSIHTLLLRKNK